MLYIFFSATRKKIKIKNSERGKRSVSSEMMMGEFVECVFVFAAVMWTREDGTRRKIKTTVFFLCERECIHFGVPFFLCCPIMME